jgi:hypothetical protein
MVRGYRYSITVEDGISFSLRENARMRGYKKSDYPVSSPHPNPLPEESVVKAM